MDHPPFYVTYKYPMGYILGIGRFQELIYMAYTLYLVYIQGTTQDRLSDILNYPNTLSNPGSQSSGPEIPVHR